MKQHIHWGSNGRMLAVVLLGAGISTMLAAQAQAPVPLGVFYMCPDGVRFKVNSCSGNEPTSPCDTDVFKGAAEKRGPAPRGQLQALFQACHVQTAAEEKSAAAAGNAAQAPPAQASSNGINVGDSVEVVTGFGWTPAKVLAIQGNNYKVLANGIQVIKTYPAEVRRVGGATAQDHASGQYRLGDRVQVNVNGQWMEGKIMTELGQDYQVQFGNRTVWANGPNLRPSTAAPPPGPPKAGTPPKPGMASCAGKIEGRYSGSQQGTITLTFRSGKVTMGDMLGGEQVLECWTAGDKIILRESGKPENDMPIDINNDGTLQTPVWGELKKKGN